MAIVSSFGAMQALTTRRNQSFMTASEVGGSVSLGATTMATYGAIYRSQPNVRICVDFRARNAAQLGLHVFRRISDTDRERLDGHQLSRWLKRPNPATTRYRLIEDLVKDIDIYFNAFWGKLRYRDADRKWQIGLLRLPPEQMSVYGGLLPSEFVWTLEDGTEKPFSPTDIVHFGGYNPDNPLIGLSPMETLRQTLAEVHAAMRHREDFWRNGARWEGVIERPKDAKWTPEQRQQFRQEMAAFRQGGAKAGSAPVLEDGMTYKPITGDAQKNEYIGGLRLAREICAAAYHIPPPMVGITDDAGNGFAAMREYHRMLYQDCLGPLLVYIEEEIEAQLLPEAEDQTNVYTEFNIAEKLKGSFEEQAAAIGALVGRPTMTVNEGRARQNLPRLDKPEYDELAAQPGTGDSNQADGETDAIEGEIMDDDTRALTARLVALEARDDRPIRDERPIIINVAMPPVHVVTGETKAEFHHHQPSGSRTVTLQRGEDGAVEGATVE